jgi:hypothetical protein
MVGYILLLVWVPPGGVGRAVLFLLSIHDTAAAGVRLGAARPELEHASIGARESIAWGVGLHFLCSPDRGLYDRIGVH